MDWLEIRAELESEPEDWSIYAEAFERAGCPSSMQIDNPPAIIGHLEYVPEAYEVAEALKQALERLGVRRVLLSTVPDVDWANLWKQHFKPIRVGKRLVVCPSWEEYEAQDNDAVITLDPGQAFGTGDHATTKMCLELLEMEFESRPPRCVLDVGCGSGILAIAAKLLGAESVVACDIDPVSVEITKRNAAANGLTLQAMASSGFDDVPDGQWPLILSNIISATLIRLAPDGASRLSEGGTWIVSGVFKDNWPDVMLAMSKQGLGVEIMLAEGEWVAASLRRANSAPA